MTEPFPHTSLTPTAYGPFRYFTQDSSPVAQSLTAYGEWGGNELRLLSKLIHPGDVVIDSGAYLGFHTVAFSHMVGLDGHVIAIEAQPAFARVLLDNVQRMAESHVHVEEAALANDGLIRLVDPSKPGVFSSGHQPGAAAYIAIRRFDLAYAWRMREDGKLPRRPDFIRLNLGGAEPAALLDAAELLEGTLPTIYAAVDNLEHGSILLDILRDLGYRCWIHLPMAFNPANPRRNLTNVFGAMRGAALVAAGDFSETAEAIEDIPPNPGWDLAPVATCDDLAAGLLTRPQYRTGVLDKTQVARALGRVW